MIGGVITSTVLTLLVTPTFYETLTDFRGWFVSKVRGTAAARADGPLPSSPHSVEQTM